MHLTALSAGYAIPQTDFDATIHSVFDSAVNLLPSNGDLLLTLVAASEADLPQGIRVATPAGFSFGNMRVANKSICRDNILYLENSHLTIDLTLALRWQSDLPSIQADLSIPAVTAAWKFIWQALNQRQLTQGAELVADDLLRFNESEPDGIAKRAREAVRKLIAAAQGDVPAPESAVRALIGLGTGLTPSGDDFLVGYLAGLWSTVRSVEERQQFITNLGKTVIRLASGTNDISRTYLYHAAHGQVSRRLEALAEAICRAEPLEILLANTKAVMQMGHTSGMDAATGLLIGLTAWDREI